MRFSEKWGVDVEPAVGLALKDLKLGRDEVEVEVLEESSSGFLGIGSKLAKVRVTAKEEISNSFKEKATFDDIDAMGRRKLSPYGESKPTYNCGIWTINDFRDIKNIPTVIRPTFDDNTIIIN